jgi:hypothetical protein
MESRPKATNRTWSWRRALAITLLLLALAGTAVAIKLRRTIPPGMVNDIRAGLAARDIPDADERLTRYLELRHGPLTNADNREKVFMAFFDTDHIKALHLIVKHSPEAQRQANIAAMERWVEGYRNTLSAEEQAALKTRFQAPEGVAMLRKATAQYNSQDVRYRGMTAPVISQLLKTIADVQAQ